MNRIRKRSAAQACLIVVLILGFSSCDSVKSYFLDTTAQSNMGRGEYGEAIMKYKRLLKINPDNIAHHWNLAIAYVQEGDIPAVREQIDELEERDEFELVHELKEMLAILETQEAPSR
jgi:tetratricopeptide (TPR) repeat protein